MLFLAALLGYISLHETVPQYFLLYLCTPLGGVIPRNMPGFFFKPSHSLPRSTLIINDHNISLLLRSFFIPLLM
jgi:hypothetical protein